MKEPFTKESIKNFILFMTLLTTTLFIALGLKFNQWIYLQHVGGIFLFYWSYLFFMWITKGVLLTLTEAFFSLMALFIMILCGIYEIQLIWFNY